MSPSIRRLDFNSVGTRYYFNIDASPNPPLTAQSIQSAGMVEQSSTQPHAALELGRRSLAMAFASICRTRSRVIDNRRPTSSRVCSRSVPRP